ncbi:MAG: CpsB/CapC family capsule biosynthesis tyrosine phosphatase [Actinomycetes bacterium]
MIDLHCHILPGIDDGPADMDGSLALARAQVECGVRTVVATPHVNLETPNDPETIARGVAEMTVALKEHDLDLTILPGAEVDITLAGGLDDATLHGLTLGGTQWLLLEAPLSPGGVGFSEAVQAVQARGFRILLAHPERSPAVQRRPEVIDDLVAVGVRCQITAGALVGKFGGVVQKTAYELVRKGVVHNVASDAHEAFRRKPGLRSELEQAGLEEATDLWCRQFPSTLLSGQQAAMPTAALLSSLASAQPTPTVGNGFLSRLRRK